MPNPDKLKEIEEFYTKARDNFNNYVIPFETFINTIYSELWDKHYSLILTDKADWEFLMRREISYLDLLLIYSLFVSPFIPTYSTMNDIIKTELNLYNYDKNKLNTIIRIEE